MGKNRWAFAMCGYFQVLNYIQPLWKSIGADQGSNDVYNGAVEATHTFLSNSNFIKDNRDRLCPKCSYRTIPTISIHYFVIR